MPDEDEKYDPLSYWVKVTRVDGGYIIETPDGVEVLGEEAPETDWGDVAFGMERECGLRMLWRVIEYFGQAGSKHDKRRICIRGEEQSH